MNIFRTLPQYGWPAFSSDAPTYDIPSRGNKDYPLWYDTGRVVVEDAALSARHGSPWLLYPTDPDKYFPFMYPPFAALLLGLLSLLGPAGMTIALVALNAISFAVAIELSVKLVAGPGEDTLWLRLIPSAISLFFVHDMFLLGQPNLGLLALVLGGLMLTRKGYGCWGGFLLALATAIKAFPVVAIVYLLWRREWKASISMLAFVLAFFILVPGLVRGFERSATELKIWSNGMLFTHGEGGIGQRPGLSTCWKNQSIFGLAPRLLGTAPMNGEEILEFDRDEAIKAEIDKKLADNPADEERQKLLGELRRIAERWAVDPGRPVYLSPFRLDHRTVTWITIGLCGLLGLSFIAAMPKPERRTPATDAAEFGMLILLMLIGTPYAYGYYFVWLLTPLTVIAHRALNGNGTNSRNLAWDVLILVVLLLAIGAPIDGNLYPMGYGTSFWATMVAYAGLIWIRFTSRPSPASPPRTSALP